MTGKCYVFAYVNPDTDGVCSSIGYSHLKLCTTGEEYLPVVFGSMNSETVFVLKYFGVGMPVINPELPEDSRIAIVDTHHVNQLPAHIPLANVVEILDHHPEGNPAAFPNATIQNDRIGAVATLVAERFKAGAQKPDGKTAGLLMAAVISNTLNFSAPSTSGRDKEVFDWLQKFAQVGPDFAQRMFKSRTGIACLSTQDLLLADYKEFRMGGALVGVSQVEAMKLQDVIGRTDLIQSLNRIKTVRNLDHLVLNIIDVFRKETLLVCSEAATQALLTQAIGADFKNDHACFDHILLRKTDLIPQLYKLLS